MARLFVPLDVEFATDPKILAAGPLAAYLYIVGLAHAKRNAGTDGLIHRSQLPVLAIGLRGKPATIARTLVDVGLWIEQEHGWQIAAWAKHNMTSAQLDASAEIAAESGAYGAHQRHHVNEGKPSSKCKWCIKDRLVRNDVPDPTGVPHGGAYWGQLAKEEVEVEEQVETEVEVRQLSSSELTPPGDTSQEDDGFINNLAGAIAQVRFRDRHPLRNTTDPDAKRYIDTTVANLLRTEMDDLRAFLAGRDHLREAANLHLAATMYDAIRNAS